MHSFDRQAKNYAAAATLQEKIAKILLDLAAVSAPHRAALCRPSLRRVLDLGAGSGAIARNLWEIDYLLALDKSGAMLKNHPAVLPNIGRIDKVCLDFESLAGAANLGALKGANPAANLGVESAAKCNEDSALNLALNPATNLAPNPTLNPATNPRHLGAPAILGGEDSPNAGEIAGESPRSRESSATPAPAFDLITAASSLHWARDLEALFGALAALNAQKYAFSIFTKNSLADLHNFLGTTSPLRDKCEVLGLLEKHFVGEAKAQIFVESFDSREALLGHLKHCGLLGGGALNFAAKKRLRFALPIRCLRYEVVFFVGFARAK